MITKRIVILLLLMVVVLTAQTINAFMRTCPSQGRSFTVPMDGLKSVGNEKQDPASEVLHAMESFLEGWNSGSTAQPSEVRKPDDARTLAKLEAAQREWKEEATRLERLEKSLVTDPDLAAFVEPRKRKDPTFIYKEAHRHDSFLAEVEHAIDTDPDLANVVGDDKTVNVAFMEREAHVHDSFLNEIAHSVDSDTDLVHD
jgi:hypothetical protein